MKKNIETATDAALQSVLDAANGRATAHTLTDPSAVRRIAREAEAVLANLGLPPAHRRGALAEYVSGKGLPNAYRYKGVATRLVFERGAKAWFLVAAERAPAYPGDTGRDTRISISDEQERLARAAMHRTLGVTVTRAAA
jgi:hypothetical protein